MAEYEEDILEAGAQLIWVLEAGVLGAPGTAESCRDFMDNRGSDQGWCVGDGETTPEDGTFDNSPFSIARGFDMIVSRQDMRVGYVTTHGTPQGNENPEGAEVLAAVVEAVSAL